MISWGPPIAMEIRMKADVLESEFASRGVGLGGTLLLASTDALALVDRAAEEGVAILGVDGHVAAHGQEESPPGELADFSGAVAEGHGCWAEAAAFIDSRRDLGLVFEVVLGGDPLEAV